MNDRYFAKVASVPDNYSIVVNKGSEHGIGVGNKFLVIGIGDSIVDPDTGEELEKLEIVRGKVVATHVQDKIATMKSDEYEKSSDIKEIKKVVSKGGGGIIGLLNSQDTVTESIKPGEEYLKPLTGVEKGDLLIKL
jgi:hypothetical protein